MQRCLLGIFGLAVLLFSSACSTVQSRIDRNPEMFAALPADDQALVLQGQVEEGMNQEAVFLAWGAPDREIVRSREGRQVDIWIYLLRRTTAVPAFSYGLRYGGYRPGWGGGVAVDVPIYDPVYITEEEPSRSVEFEGGRVVGWSKTTDPAF